MGELAIPVRHRYKTQNINKYNDKIVLSLLLCALQKQRKCGDDRSILGWSSERVLCYCFLAVFCLCKRRMRNKSGVCGKGLHSVFPFVDHGWSWDRLSGVDWPSRRRCFTSGRCSGTELFPWSRFSLLILASCYVLSRFYPLDAWSLLTQLCS